jgi:hypothetical protein
MPLPWPTASNSLFGSGANCEELSRPWVKELHLFAGPEGDHAKEDDVVQLQLEHIEIDHG